MKPLLSLVSAGLLVAVPMIIGAAEPDPADQNKVFLRHADRLVHTPGSVDEFGEYQVLVGNVVMTKGGMTMTCDSAHFYDQSNSFEAFGNVRMEQGDTLFVYGDRLFYDGPQELATLSGDLGRKVRMINRDVTLQTYIFYYDLADEVGYYDNWGELTDPTNRLVSIEGEYSTRDKNAWFYHQVELTGNTTSANPTRMTTDSLNYNTVTHIAEILAPTVIVNDDGTIYSTSGTYNTETGQADLYARSTVRTFRGNTLTGDTLFFDRSTGVGEAFGNMILTDSARQVSLFGDYGYYNDPIDSAFVTGRALAKEYSRGDTLYLHGDTINAWMELVQTDSLTVDTMHVMNAFHRVRFYRSDIQGLCDSVSVTERDSLLRMYRHPVIWSGERQIAGNVIYLHVNDSVPDWARLPESGLMSEHIAEDCFNQLGGTDMTAFLNDSTIERLYVEGNVQMILFPMENDSTYNKYIFLESSTMDAYFEDQRPKKINFWPETTYDVVPLYLAKRSAYKLADFRDYSDLRPVSPADVFVVPQGMTDLMSLPADDDKPRRSRAATTRTTTGAIRPKGI
ncbi:MAG: LPS export ABC transporter periplasmic protein LptC [Clostridium sp.]|nr:LPS export ABC transporter periplasmic protein LptC [Clostridium sp.]